MIERWEYLVVMIAYDGKSTVEQDARIVTRELNRYGAAGWELISVNNRLYHFKRKV